MVLISFVAVSSVFSLSSTSFVFCAAPIVPGEGSVVVSAFCCLFLGSSAFRSVLFSPDLGSAVVSSFCCLPLTSPTLPEVPILVDSGSKIGSPSFFSLTLSVLRVTFNPWEVGSAVVLSSFLPTTLSVEVSTLEL
uniref:Uncharacterized protein n=1 Tax=Arundo donax TaxID=35708 RepID=A0A0A9DXR6_ARUDO